MLPTVDPDRDPERVRLVVDIDSTAEPIEGELIEPSSHATRFRGWLSLASLIEASRHPDEHPGTEGDTG